MEVTEKKLGNPCVLCPFSEKARVYSDESYSGSNHRDARSRRTRPRTKRSTLLQRLRHVKRAPTPQKNSLYFEFEPPMREDTVRRAE